MNTDTQETDDLARGNHVVPTEWAQQLERERDEAREDATNYYARIGELERERDKALGKVEQQRKEIVRLNGATNHAGGTPLKIALRERDEAREEAAHWKTEYEIVVARLCGKKHPRDNGIISEHEIISKLTQERNEARARLEIITRSKNNLVAEYFSSNTPETDAAVIASNGQWSFVLKETCQRLERERDEEQNRCRKLESALSYPADGQTLLSKFLQAVKDRDRALEQRDDAREILQAVLKNKFGVRCQFIDDEQD